MSTRLTEYKVIPGIPFEFYVRYLDSADLLIDLSSGYTAKLEIRDDLGGTTVIQATDSDDISFGTFSIDSVDHNIKVLLPNAKTELITSTQPHHMGLVLYSTGAPTEPILLFNDVLIEVEPSNVSDL